MPKIRIYTDESVNVAIAEGLKRRGVSAFSAKEAGNLGLSDIEKTIVMGAKASIAWLIICSAGRYN